MNATRISALIEAWFATNRRTLPWRTRRTAWRSLVSEFMLQQTQVSRVLEKFEPFMERFPDPASLAEADEQEVLTYWQGLGYYRRARNLKRAAEDIVEHFGGRTPLDIEPLETLPGIGKYTAGAIASIAGRRRAPIVDGNVQRVLARLHEDDAEPTSKPALDRAWQRAEDLVEACRHPDLLNEGMMELGALLCTPRSPLCSDCPLKGGCMAKRSGSTDRIPPPKKPAVKLEQHHHAVVVRRNGRLLMEQRGDDGIWAGLWQVPTVESKRKLVPSQVRRRCGIELAGIDRLGSFTHVLSHRRIHVHVFRGDAAPGARAVGRSWQSRSNIDSLPVSNAVKRVLEMC
jgi:A/G-specific adenine glycosylase